MALARAVHAMRDEDKTKEQLLEEVRALRDRLAKVEDLAGRPEHDGRQGRWLLSIDRLPLAYIAFDADTRVLDWNRAAEKLFGYDREEAVGQEAFDLILPLPVNEQVRDVLRRIRIGDMDAHSINENRTRDGRTITCEWFNTPLLDSEGRFQGAVSLVRDVTDQKRAEEKRRRSEALLAEAERLAHLGGWEWNIPGNVVLWSRELYRIFGLDPNSFGATYEAFLERVHPEDRASVSANNRLALQNHLPFEYTCRIVRPDGELRTVHARGQVGTDGAGHAVCLIGTCQDVTERRRMEEPLRDTEELFQQLATNIEGYFWVNAIDDSAMYYMSPGYEKITGRSCASLYERPESWTDSIHPEDHARILAAAVGPPPEKVRHLEYRIVRPDGSIRWVRDRVFPVRNAAGEVYRIAGIGEDVTERKQAEEKVREYHERVQALSRRLLAVQEEERRRLARDLHDGILQSLTCLHLLLEPGPMLSADDVQANLQEVRATLDDLTATLRTLSADLRPPMLDQLGLLPALLWLVERFTAQTGVRIDFRHEGLGGRFAPTTETAAYRLVQEALANVARHAGVSEVSVRVWVQGDGLHLQIEDEGVGFDPEAALVSGAAAALTGMWERVQLLGGKLTIDSAPGEGTHVKAELPLAAECGVPGRPFGGGNRSPFPQA
jgi:PAS domain S-box-containing protein